MQPLYLSSVCTYYGEKEICVYNCDILDFDEKIDILTTSAGARSYYPTRGTIFWALTTANIFANALAENPEIDLRQLCNVWLSKKIEKSHAQIKRIGCVEFDYILEEQDMINSIKSYFKMLDIAATYGIEMETVALPLLGSGNQRIAMEFTIYPIVNECIAFLKRNAFVKRICFIEKDSSKAFFISDFIKNSYNLIIQKGNAEVAKEPIPLKENIKVFISYSSVDTPVAEMLSNKLEQSGIKTWYAKRDVEGAYARAIAMAVDSSTHFIVILSKDSVKSEHVLNEVDLAFQKLPDKIKINPIRIDDTEFTPSFKYYLSRQNWKDASIPPLEERLDEFVKSFLVEFN